MNAALLVTALFNGAWQGAVLCTLAVLAFRLFRRLNATTMFTVWSVLLAIAVLLPFANYAFAPKPYNVVRIAPAHTLSTAVYSAPRHSVMRRYRSTAERSRGATPPTIDLAASSRTVLQSVLRFAPAILLALAAIALLRLAILARDILRMLDARRRVRPIDAPVALSGEIGRPFRFAASEDFTSPCVLGFAPALIVLPEELLAQHSPQLASVVLHEREHVRRFDDVQNVIQRFIGAVAFFCPGVRTALRELALYREQICDDAAVNATGDRVSYAMTLTGLAQWAQGRGTPVPSLIFKRKHLLHRLEVLLDSAVSHSMRMNRRFAITAAAAVVIAAVLVLHVQVPVIAETVIRPAIATSTPVKTHAASAAVRPKIAAPRLHVAPVRLHAASIHPHLVVLRPHVVTVRRKAVTMHRHVVAVQRAAAASVTAFAMSPAVATVAYAAVAPRIADANAHDSGDLLNALAAAGLRNLPIDQLIALRDHGVNPAMIQAAASYFGHVSADDLVYLSDHGVGPIYIETLRGSGVLGISPHDAVTLMDHGVSGALIHSANEYFTTQRPQAKDLVYMADHGVGAPFLDALRSNHITGLCWQDTVNMLDHGVDAAYVVKIRRTNPRATISDIIRLHDAGF